jgi:hypothetical protein
MVDLILDNLPVVLFIVIAIVIRTMRARFSTRRTESSARVFASPLEPDDDDEAGDLAGPEDYDVRGQDSALARETAAVRIAPRMTEVDRPRFAALPGLSADEAPAVSPEAEPVVLEAEKYRPALRGMKKDALSPAAGEGGNVFSRLQGYSFPQRAVVWAEILGKPKGME